MAAHGERMERAGSCPTVSMGLPVYNGEPFLRQALDSLLAQTFRDFELVISDNASTDATFAICQEYASRDPRIVLSRNEVNQGAVANFRVVLERARGQYFMWTAADDRWQPEFLQVLLKELEGHPDAAVAMCGVERVDQDGRPMDTIRFPDRDDPGFWSPYATLKGLVSTRKYNLFIYGLFRASLLKKAVNLFPEVLGGDRIFLCQIALAARFRYVDRILYVRTHQPHHTESDLKESRRVRVLLRQVYCLGRSLAKSSIIPWRRKTLIPLILVRCCILVFGRAYAPRKVWTLLTWYLNSDVDLTAMALASALAYPAVVVVVAQLGGLLLAAVTALVLAVLAFSLLLWWKLWRRVGRLQRESRMVGELVLELAPLERQVGDRAHDVGRVAPVENRKPEAQYAHERFEGEHGMVAFARAVESSKIRNLFLAEIFPGIEEVAVPIGAISESRDYLDKGDMLYVCAIARFRGARRIFEFGTCHGRTTYHLTFSSDDAHVTTLSLPPDADPRHGPYLGCYFRGKDREKRITQLYGDSQTFDTSPYRRQFDFVLVDSSHHPKAVKEHTLKAFELLNTGGAIIWNDYGPGSEELVQFFLEFTQKRSLFRIKRTCLLLHLDGVDPLTFRPYPLPPGLERDSLSCSAFSDGRL